MIWINPSFDQRVDGGKVDEAAKKDEGAFSG